MPAAGYRLKAVLPKYPLVDDRIIHRAVRDVNHRYGQKAKRLYEKTTATWRHQPTFMVTDGEVTGPGQSFEFVTMVQPEGAYKDIFTWIDAGTRRRFAVMTPDFRPKTTRRVLSSRPGRGGFSHMSLGPRPGIRAREFSKEIADRMFVPYTRSMRAAVNRAVRTKQNAPAIQPLQISARPRP
jgi:hypothetical protein